MKYYDLDPIEKEFHNKVLVDILSLGLQQGHSKTFDTRIPYENLERFDVGGEGYRIREKAVKYVVTHVNHLGDRVLLPKLAEMTGAFKELDLTSATFEEQYVGLLDKLISELFALAAEYNDEERQRDIIGSLWEISDARYFIGRESARYVFRWKSAQIKLLLEEAYEDGRLDRDLVDKVLAGVFDSETNDDWVRTIREVVSIFTTPMN